MEVGGVNEAELRSAGRGHGPRLSMGCISIVDPG
jgi:hypothetical protein